MSSMTGPVPNNQDEPLDAAAYQHHLLLLKSAHCCRPVIFDGRNQFIHTLTLHQDGGRLGMIVYLAGITGGVDCSQIQIKGRTA